MNEIFGIIFLTSVTVNYSLPTEEILYVAESNKFYEQKFNDSIQRLRLHLNSGIPLFEIPPCDPLIFEHPVRLYIPDNQILQTNLKLNNLIITGLLNFDVVSIRLTSDLVLVVKYRFKNIKITSSHERYMNLLGLMGITTDGEMDLKILDMDVTTVTKYNVKPPLIGDYKMTVKVGSVNLNVTELQQDEEYSETISKFLSYIAPPVINYFHEEVTEELRPKVQKKLNLI